MPPTIGFTSDACKGNSFVRAGASYYPPAIMGASSIAAKLFSPEVYDGVHGVLSAIAPDDYVEFLKDYMRAGRNACGSDWQYADICTVLYVLARMLKPEDYLEIGVRQGRSLAMVAAQRPNLRIIACDMWMQNYAGMPNPGPQFVVQQLERLQCCGGITFLSGDSHSLLPEHFSKHPRQTFDLITVDGDHSPQGAAADLRTVLPRLRVGGAIVFDDIAHPSHPELATVWNNTVKNLPCMSSFEFTELGYGIAFAVRMY